MLLAGTPVINNFVRVKSLQISLQSGQCGIFSLLVEIFARNAGAEQSMVFIRLLDRLELSRYWYLSQHENHAFAEQNAEKDK